ncbi:predicted protein [Uncinocarpus reesii 1704]|uniref:NAD(P)-binding domain-containing protein n=1 Tax=Uncinocarpus reesii (strain UAMH 1704) TaxID=336963 RepID=C4JDK4_UNCRE|nr:uncharacterized protein UREG_00713 [Uncinocarpus reesii 1704]EEP75866.1 predicted protein [Uncinocarpus reesii 1704]
MWCNLHHINPRVCPSATSLNINIMFMKLLIFGATGAAGGWTARKAIAHGHDVTLHVRDENRVPGDIKNSGKVKIIQGILSDEESLSEAVQGQDAILSCIGPNGPWPSKGELSNGYRLIFRLMRRHNVRRVIAMATISCYDERDSFALSRLLAYSAVFVLARTAQNEILAIEEAFKEEGQGLDWTLCRVPVLGSSSKDGGMAEAGWVGDGKWNAFLERRDWANWMIREAERDQPMWVGEMPALYTPKR